MDKKQILDLLENLLVDSERLEANIKYEVVSRIIKEVKNE
jgi:hypothetical protein